MRGYFEGWYLKQQNEDSALALIPAYHRTANGRETASIQVLAGNDTYNIDFNPDQFDYDRDRRMFAIGKSVFTHNGAMIDIDHSDISVKGRLMYTSINRPAYDIMGPFRFAPFMQCRHSVFSMLHEVNGCVKVNGRDYCFNRDIGYIEGDRGSSFPKRYIWTQCMRKNFSIMMSVADIPYAGTSFVGCTGFIYARGRELRIATYRGAHVEFASNHGMSVTQGGYRLTVRLISGNSGPLRAPCQGDMRRTIHESLVSRVNYRLTYNDRRLFDFTDDNASFEGMWNYKKAADNALL